MKNLLTLVALLFFLPAIIYAQIDLSDRGVPKNMISIAPANNSLFETTNTLYYKRLLNQNGRNLLYARFGLGLADRFTNEDDAGRLVDPVSPDRRSLNLNLGLEWYRRLGDFSLTFGPEIGYSRASFFQEVVTVSEGRVFSLRGLSLEQDFGMGASYYRAFNLAAFVGIRYHIGQHFQFGLESALGWSFYRVENEYEPGINRLDPDFTGTIRELAIGRHFILEVNF